MDETKMIQLKRHVQQSTEEFEHSELFIRLKNVIDKSRFHLDVEYGTTKQRRYTEFGISIALKDESNNYVLGNDEEGYVMAYTPIATAGKNRIRQYKWEDAEFVSDIEEMMRFVIEHSA